MNVPDGLGDVLVNGFSAASAPPFAMPESGPTPGGLA